MKWLAVLVLFACGACVRVQPWQREPLTWQADFYQARYRDLAPLMSGDMRLGPIRGHTTSVELTGRFLERPGALGALLVSASYDVSLTDYELLATDLIVGQTLGVSVGAEF